VTRGQLPQRAGSLRLNSGGTAAAVPPKLGHKGIGTGIGSKTAFNIK